MILSLSLKTSDFAIVFGYSESIISHTRYVFFPPRLKQKLGPTELRWQTSWAEGDL